ncbi:hypothetical protein RhiJN_10543 [Ceratobasidium sp. AG-Ba]|nr:hypothetical protein RhiJN_10543 [Ceratobasidium sp. AG-Ba]
MASRPTANSDEEFRHRIQGVTLDPLTSNYDIAAEIKADGTRVCKLPRIKKGRSLEWNDLYAICDVRDGSVVTVQVTEVHIVNDRVGRAEYQVTRDNEPDSISIVCSAGGKKMFVVHVRIMGKNGADRAYAEALATAKELLQKTANTERSSKAVKAFEKIMAFNGIVVQLDPTGGAKEALSVCVKAWQQLEAQQSQNATLSDLLDNLASTIPTIESVEKIADVNLRKTVVQMQKLIEDASLFILSVKPSNKSERTLYNKFSSAAQEESEHLVKRSKLLRKEFRERMSAQTLRTVELDGIREKLKELKPVELANYNPSRLCLDGTRTGIIDSLKSWAQAPDPRTGIAWVHGLAGLGKSSVLTSVSKLLDDQGILCCSFFCKRNSPGLRDPRRVLMTLVCELAQRWSPYASAVAEVISKNISLHSKHIQPLYQALVVDPCEKIGEAEKPGTLAIVIDALDECGDAETRYQLLTCLHHMSQLLSFLRVIVSSRPEDDIRSYFRESDRDWYSEFNLLQYDARADIRMFIEHSLRRLTSSGDWPPEAVEQLSTRASGLFIWAQTACAYIHSGVNKLKRLETLIAGQGAGAIDALYTTILTAKETFGDEDNAKEMREYLSLIIVTSIRDTVSVATLVKLMGKGTSQEALQGTINRLSAIIYIDDQAGHAIRVSHPSFLDFITDRTRSEELCVKLEHYNTILAKRCLETMKQELTFNICGLETSEMLNRDISDLDLRIQQAISPQLKYACTNWSDHLAFSPLRTVGPLLHAFLLGPEVIYWLEVLSLLSKLSIAPSSLLQVTKSCVEDDWASCRTMAQDAYRFVLAFYDTISASTPHLYISALAAAPSGSLISKRMRPFFPNIFAIINDQSDTHWTPCIRSIPVGSAVHSLATSPNGARIVCGCEDGTVRLWDAETGEAVLTPFLGHAGVVKCVAFDHEGRSIISGSLDKEARVWDMETGKTTLGPLKGHAASVTTVSCSHDGSIIASGSEDCTVRLWSSSTGKALFQPLLGHIRAVVCVVFSPDDRTIVSTGGEGTARLWDAKTGSLLFEPFEGPERAIAFSLDGRRLLSMPAYGKMNEWDTSTGKKAGYDSFPEISIRSAAFSVDSNLVAWSDPEDTISIWDIQSGRTVLGCSSGHTERVRSLAFLPGLDRVVSGSDDMTIRVWDIARNLSDPSLEQTSFAPRWRVSPGSAIFSVAFSSDNRFIASGHFDETVRIWDVATGQSAVKPLEGLSAIPASITFSPDNSLVHCASFEGTVGTWDCVSGHLAHKKSFQSPSKSMEVGAFSPDGRLFANGYADGKVRIWNIESGDMTAETLSDSLSCAVALAFSPDGYHLASGLTNKTVFIWEVKTGNIVLGPLDGHTKSISAIAYSADGLRIASGSSNGTICIWHAKSGDLLSKLQESAFVPVHCIAFSRGGQFIACGSSDGILHIWDSITEKMMYECFVGVDGDVSRIAISPDDCYIVCTATDGALRLVDATRYFRPDVPSRHLPGTTIAALPENVAGEKLVISTGQLVRSLDTSTQGWVTTPDKRLIVWLPHELQKVDDSYMRISFDGPQRQWVDFTRFVHGKDWTLVKEHKLG